MNPRRGSDGFTLTLGGMLAISLLAVAASPAWAANRPQGGCEMVKIPGNVLPALNRATRVKKPAASKAFANQPITVTIVLKRDHEKAFERYLRELYDPRSRRYHRFATQEELARRFGPSRAEYDGVLRYLRTNGFKLIEGSKNRLTITMRGTRAQAERAFTVNLANYRIGKRTFFANDRNPAVPAPIAPVVEAVVGLSNYAQPLRVGSGDIPDDAKEVNEGNLAYSCWVAEVMDTGEMGKTLGELSLEPEFELSAVSPAVTVLHYQCMADELNLVARYAAGGGGETRTGSELQTRSAAAIASGAGQTVGLLEFDNFHESDVQDFLNLIGYGDRISQLSEVDVDGGAGAPGAGESEVLLDIDTVMSLAPGAKVALFDGPFNGRGSFQTMLNAMIGAGVNVISNSWAYCEDQTDAADLNSLDQVLASAAAAGITVVSGSGDRGSTCLDGSANTLSVPADAPHITAVGATTANPNLVGTYGTEKWWDGLTDTPPTGQGGFGVSNFFHGPPIRRVSLSACIDRCRMSPRQAIPRTAI